MNYNTNLINGYKVPKYADVWIDHPPYQYLILHINQEDFDLKKLPIEPFSFRYLSGLNGGSCQVSYLIENIAPNVLNWFNEVIESFISHLINLGIQLKYFVEDYTYTKEIAHWNIYTAINRNFLEFKHK